MIILSYLSTLPTAGHVLYVHAQHLAQYVGAGCQQVHACCCRSQQIDLDAECNVIMCAGYVLQRALVHSKPSSYARWEILYHVVRR